MAIGYNLALTLAAGAFAPILRKSAAGNLTMGSAGAVVTIPWVENANSGTGDLDSVMPGLAIEAALRALVSDRSTNGNPT